MFARVLWKILKRKRNLEEPFKILREQANKKNKE